MSLPFRCRPRAGAVVALICALSSIESAGIAHAEPASPAPATAGRVAQKSHPDPPLGITRYPLNLDPELKGVRVSPDSIHMVQGGQLVRKIAFNGAGRPVPLDEIVSAVADKNWLAEVTPGVFEFSAALVQTDVSVVAASPRVRQVRMIDRPGVFWGGSHAVGRIAGVKITSWDPKANRPDTNLKDGRPFIIFEDSSRLDIIDSQLSYLGSDLSSSYGVSWRLDSGGEISGSTFDHNFFGVYTFRAKDISFKESKFHHNVLYGIDPHDYTSGLRIENNEAFANGSHGIIISKAVNDAVIRANSAHHNKGNGIVIDLHSSGAQVVGNRVVSNKKDGIVILGSPRSNVAQNQVRGNRVGIRVNQVDSRLTRIVGNLVKNNEVGIQTYGGASESSLEGNSIWNNRRTGVVVAAPRTTIRAGTIKGSSLGLDIRTIANIQSLSVAAVTDGIAVRDTGFATLDDIDIRATRKGIRIQPDALVTLENSNVRAPQPVDGGSISRRVASRLIPVRSTLRSWLPLFGLGAIVIAFLLESVRWFRSRRNRRAEPKHLGVAAASSGARGDH